MVESWSSHIAIVVEGILRQPNDSSVITAGLMLYKSLVKDHRVSLIFDSSGKEKIQYWLLMNGMTDHVKEIYQEKYDPEDTAERRIVQIGRLRQDGPLSLVYEADLNAAIALYKADVPCMMFMHPQYLHPEFRPDSKTKLIPWNEILAEQVRQQEAKALDIPLDDF